MSDPKKHHHGPAPTSVGAPSPGPDSVGAPSPGPSTVSLPWDPATNTVTIKCDNGEIVKVNKSTGEVS
jgi:hypothetical protein